MDKLKAMEAFVRVVDTGGFTRAAELLQTPKASISTWIQDLESSLGVRLLHRTTRRVMVTPDGAAFYERCLRILEDVKDAEDAVSARHALPSGRLRVDVATSMASHLLIPALPGFIKRYPDIRLELGCSDRPVNLLTEGVDCVIRVGDLHDPGLIARRVGAMHFVTCASLDYLAQHGEPTHPNDLKAHACVNYFLHRTGLNSPWDFEKDGEHVELMLDGPVSINDSNAHVDACVAGMGISQMPNFVFDRVCEQGRLKEVLSDWSSAPLPVNVVYPSNRHLSTKVRVFVEWAAEMFERHVAPTIRRPLVKGSEPRPNPSV